MNNISMRLSAALVLAAAAAQAAVVKPVSLSPVLGRVSASPALQAAVLSQISQYHSLSADPALPAAPAPGTPEADAARLVGALAARPQAIAESKAELTNALGDTGFFRLKRAAARLDRYATERPELAARLEGLRQGLDLADESAVNALGERWKTMFDGANASEDKPVAAGGSVVLFPAERAKAEKSSPRSDPAQAPLVKSEYDIAPGEYRGSSDERIIVSKSPVYKDALTVDVDAVVKRHHLTASFSFEPATGKVFLAQADRTKRYYRYVATRNDRENGLRTHVFQLKATGDAFEREVRLGFDAKTGELKSLAAATKTTHEALRHVNHEFEITGIERRP